MGRKASGGEWLEQAKACLAKAKTVEELRQAQAVVLPLQFGLSLEATAQAVGLSVGWACQLRRRFVRAVGVLSKGLAKKGGRRHENMAHDEEVAFLASFFKKAKVRGLSDSISSAPASKLYCHEPGIKEDLQGGPRPRCLFVGDAGMVSQANLQALSKGGGKYLLAKDVCSRKRNADGRLIGQRSLNW